MRLEFYHPPGKDLAFSVQAPNGGLSLQTHRTTGWECAGAGASAWSQTMRALPHCWAPATSPECRSRSSTSHMVAHMVARKQGWWEGGGGAVDKEGCTPAGARWPCRAASCAAGTLRGPRSLRSTCRTDRSARQFRDHPAVPCACQPRRSVCKPRWAERQCGCTYARLSIPHSFSQICVRAAVAVSGKP
jgi:hypothetical protein